MPIKTNSKRAATTSNERKASGTTTDCRKGLDTNNGRVATGSTLANTFMVLALAITLGACASPSLPTPTATDGAFAARGGDAKGEQGQYNPLLAGSYMGDAVNARASTEDLVQATNAAGTFSLVFPGGRAADAVEKSYAAEMAMWMEKMIDADDDEMAVAKAGLDAARAALTAYVKSKPVVSAEGVTLPSKLVYAPFYFQWGAVTPEKLQADVVKAAGEGIKSVMQAASNATE